MKKLLALLLVLSMMLAMLVACGGKNPDGSQETQGNKPSNKPNKGEDEYDITEILPESLNYNNAEVVLCIRGDDDNYWEIGLSEEDTQPLTAELYDRTTRTEERLGVSLDVDKLNGWASYNDAIATIRSKITMNEHVWDIVVGWSPRIPQIAAEGLYYNLLNFSYFDASNIWWSQSLAKELTVNGKMFMASGDVSTSYLTGAHAVFFNQALAKAMDMDYSTFYKTVSEGKWTFTELYNLSKDAYSDKDGGGVVTADDRFGLLIQSTMLQALYTAAGVNLIPNNGVDRPTFNVNTDELEQIWAKIQLLIESPATVDGVTDGTFIADMSKHFVDGNALFMLHRLGALKDFTNMKDGFGVLPVPKYDEAQTNYYTQLHSCELWSIPVDANDPEMSAAVMTSMGYDSHEVVLEPHFEKLLKTRYVKDSESGYMIDTIYYNIYMNFDSIYNEVLQPGNDFNDKNVMPMFMFGAIASSAYGSANMWWDANKGGLEDELKKILDGFYND